MKPQSPKRIIPLYKKDSDLNERTDHIVKILKRLTKNDKIKLPRYISFHLENGILSLIIQEQDGVEPNGNHCTLNPTCNNMQTDNAAFEGWAICLKCWLPDIKSVLLKWDTPQPKIKTLHYNRFLYRVMRFKEAFPGWFIIDKTNEEEVVQFASEFKDIQNNSYSDEPKPKIDGKFGETTMEFEMVTTLSEQMCNHFGLTFIDRQLPVGLKKNSKQFFTGGGSAIDLWGMTGNRVSIIELKYNTEKSKNAKVGIVSELFLYACVIRDIARGIIKPPTKCPKDCETFFYQESGKVTLINAEMLSNGFHPLINSNDIIQTLNQNSFEDVKIIFRKNSYSYDEQSKLLSFLK